LHPQHETSRDSETQTKEDFKASQENELEACQWFHRITVFGTNIETPTSRITEWTECHANRVGTRKQLKTLSL